MRHLPLSLSAILSVFNFLACSSSSTFTSTDSGTETAATACAHVAQAQCQKRETCSLGSFSNDYLYGNETDCETRVTPSCVSALSAQGTAQSPTNLDNCVKLYPNYSCTDFRDNDPSGACVPPAGTHSNGAACGANAQCTSTFCHVAQYQTCGICADPPPAGTACDYNGDCGRDMDCAIPTGATSGTCANYVALNGTCLTGANPCQSGLACVGDDETTTPPTTGTCQTQANTVGAPCDRSRKTMANCDFQYGLTCVPTAAGSSVGTCQPMTLVGPGATCGVLGSAPITGEAECNAGGLCVKVNTTDATGTCLATAADGAACNTDATVGPPCLSPAKCVPTAVGSTAGTCVMPDATKCL